VKNINYYTIYIAIFLLIGTAYLLTGCSLQTPAHAGQHELPGFVFERSETAIAINQVRNYQDISRAFTLPTDAEAHIICCGEMIIGEPNAKRDVFEMYFDKSNNKLTAFESKDDKFFYFSEKGSSPKAKTAFYNTSDTTYNIEIAIPFQELKAPGVNQSFGFDFAYSDNDNGFEQEKQVAWHSIDSDIWLNSRLWGNLVFVKSKQAPNDSFVISLQTPRAPVIDGKADACWNNLPATATRHILRGNVQGDQDIKCELRSLWNDKMLFFMVAVTDNKIVKQSFIGKLFDYGWIEDSKGNTVWKANRNNAKHSGGAGKNFCIDTAVFLKAGNYTLHYHSDESHSFNNWDDTPPADTIYGIRVTAKDIQ
jgi:hypothetical protein